MHHQHRHGDLLQVFGEVPLGEGNDAVIVRLGASHHALAPPIPDHSLRGFRTRPVVTRSEEHTSELQSRLHLVCRLLLEKKKNLCPKWSIVIAWLMSNEQS